MSNKLDKSKNLTNKINVTKLEVENENLRNENEALRGRPSDRTQIGEDTESVKRQRKKVGRHSKLDCTHLINQYPDILGGKALRWVNDEDGAVQHMEQLDWQVVELVGLRSVSDRRFNNAEKNESQSQIASPVIIPAGRGKNHDHIFMVLMMKDMDLYKQDEVEEQRLNMKAQEQSYLAGKIQASGQDNGRVENVGTYAPNVGGGIRGMSIQQQLMKGD